ncbi:hypothetical protein FGO68_gene10414 [Halteria grandinella]|uniref:Uncharacterized protein n=1 Tax=Halteria grandinella TaxID=5974 RepID=A0A8J8NNI2_HALGN|nr:hypothetical protein FGO68_gene10414 [Halteria grandinella]
MSVTQPREQTQHQLAWTKEWIELVLQERARNRSNLQGIKGVKCRDAHQYYEQVHSSEVKSDQQIAFAGELVLQEIFGMLARDLEDGDEVDQKWVYGLLCMLEKPLLAEQAGDLNQMLNGLLKKRGQGEMIAEIDVNICIITEYFGQRFR